MAEPVRTRRSNIVFLGPTPDVGDAWCQHAGSVVYMSWQLTEEERAAVAAGGLIRLGVFQSPIPPVSLGVDDDAPLSSAGAALRDRAREIVRQLAQGPRGLPSGYWWVSGDVWEALQAEQALDNEPGAVPSLYGRPLMAADIPADPSAATGEMRYVVADGRPVGHA